MSCDSEGIIYPEKQEEAEISDRPIIGYSFFSELRWTGSQVQNTEALGVLTMEIYMHMNLNCNCNNSIGLGRDLALPSSCKVEFAIQ